MACDFLCPGNRTVAGIDLDPQEPGYKHIIIHPRPPVLGKVGGGEGLSWARGELQTRYGRVACAWRVEQGQLAVNVEVPPNTHATVILPGRKPRAVEAGTHAFRVPFARQ